MEHTSYSKLRGLMREMGYTEAMLAKELGISRTSLSYKINGRRGFTQEEMAAICDILGTPICEIHLIFYPERASSRRNEAGCPGKTKKEETYAC